MADISKCNDALCPSRKNCWRYLAPSGFRQSFVITNRESDADNCELFWKVDKCPICGLKNMTHKLSCTTQKIQINL